jgi:hypothetical protein
MKFSNRLLVVFLALLSIGCSSRNQDEVWNQYEVHIFSEGPEPVLEGEVHSSWFSPPDPTIERIREILVFPDTAEVFGTVSLRSLDASWVYPMYSWQLAEVDYKLFGIMGPEDFIAHATNRNSLLSRVVRIAEQEAPFRERKRD